MSGETTMSPAFSAGDSSSDAVDGTLIWLSICLVGGTCLILGIVFFVARSPARRLGKQPQGAWRQPVAAAVYTNTSGHHVAVRLGMGYWYRGVGTIEPGARIVVIDAEDPAWFKVQGRSEWGFYKYAFVRKVAAFPDGTVGNLFTRVDGEPAFFPINPGSKFVSPEPEMELFTQVTEGFKAPAESPDSPLSRPESTISAASSLQTVVPHREHEIRMVAPVVSTDKPGKPGKPGKLAKFEALAMPIPSTTAIRSTTGPLMAGAPRVAPGANAGGYMQIRGPSADSGIHRSLTDSASPSSHYSSPDPYGSPSEFLTSVASQPRHYFPSTNSSTANVQAWTVQ